jgi:transitional endoplasmic reticulum ATPase
MKIKRVETRSFAISEKAERNAENRFLGGILKRLIKRLLFKEETEIIKSYRILAKFKVSRLEEIHKGVVGDKKIYETKSNYFYVDMSNAELYTLHGRRIERLDILKKIIKLPRESVRLLGELMRSSFKYKEELDRNSIFDLASLGYIAEYKETLLMLFKGVWDELHPEEKEKTVVKDRIKATVHIPRFDNSCYDLSTQLEETDTIDDTYSKDAIKYSIDKLSQMLSDLFDAKVILTGVTFMPYLTALYRRVDKRKIKAPDRYFPVCFIHDFRVKKKTGVKLKPIALSTSIAAEGSIPVEESTIDFSDVGGLEYVKKEIREAIIYPLTKPDLAKEFGKKGGGAILLYGPPGCGKSYIAKATIGECGVPFFNVNISEIVSKGVEAEAESLHEVFEEASKESPSIIFFDEIDAIGGRRTGATGYAEKMEIDQFLMEMDGVETTSKDVLIIAATNVPWNIDPALRRSVRFTKHIFIPPPDLEAREGIFRIHTRGKPIAEDIDYRKLAELTEGYASSDIKAICDLAAEIPWGEALKGGEERKIETRDFIEAIKKQKSSLIPWFKMAHKELRKSGEESLFDDFGKYILKYGGGVDQIEKPEINFSDVGNLEEVKEEIKKCIVYPLIKPELSKEFKKEVGGAILFYGPPGCGKTYIARATAGECAVTFFNVRITDILSEKTGESEKNIQDIFERASGNLPAILFFDEIDAIVGRRDHLDTEAGKRLINAFLTEMDGFKKTSGLVIIGATNMPWAIDPALRRSERFTKQIYIPSPDVKAREEIFRIHTRGKPIAEDIDYRKLAELTEGYASSDIKTVCDLAAEIPWEEALKGGEERKIETRDLLKVIEKYTTSLIPWYRSADKQIKESGEEDLYKELLEHIEEFSKTTTAEGKIKELLEEEKSKVGLPSKKEREEMSHLLSEREELGKKIENIKKRFHDGAVDENVFREILEEYEKQLIEIDVKIEILKGKRMT